MPLREASVKVVGEHCRWSSIAMKTLGAIEKVTYTGN
jgi:hypothetical protein